MKNSSPPYPYKRFAVVENFLSTGYSLPTFTLLGQEVVKLPFIVETSLGHESCTSGSGIPCISNPTGATGPRGLPPIWRTSCTRNRRGRGGNTGSSSSSITWPMSMAGTNFRSVISGGGRVFPHGPSGTARPPWSFTC